MYNMPGEVLRLFLGNLQALSFTTWTVTRLAPPDSSPTSAAAMND
jgi:hypothetical protein